MAPRKVRRVDSSRSALLTLAGGLEGNETMLRKWSDVVVNFHHMESVEDTDGNIIIDYVFIIIIYFRNKNGRKRDHCIEQLQ